MEQQSGGKRKRGVAYGTWKKPPGGKGNRPVVSSPSVQKSKPEPGLVCASLYGFAGCNAVPQLRDDLYFCGSAALGWQDLRDAKAESPLPPRVNMLKPILVAVFISAVILVECAFAYLLI